MKTCGEAEVELHMFVTLAVHEAEWSHFKPWQLYPFGE
jgi:hypothetical protein